MVPSESSSALKRRPGPARKTRSTRGGGGVLVGRFLTALATDKDGNKAAEKVKIAKIRNVMVRAIGDW
jgi:hypothetical protein